MLEFAKLWTLTILSNLRTLMKEFSTNCEVINFWGSLGWFMGDLSSSARCYMRDLVAGRF